MLKIGRKKVICIAMAIIYLMCSLVTAVNATGNIINPNNEIGIQTNNSQTLLPRTSSASGTSVLDGSIYTFKLGSDNLYMEALDEISVVLGNNPTAAVSKWELIHVQGDYYKIKNVQYKTYLTATGTISNGYYTVNCQSEYTGTDINIQNKQLWKFTSNDSTNCTIIKSKYNENTDLVLASSNEMGSYGYYLVQKNHTNDTYLTDEFKIILNEEKVILESGTYYFMGSVNVVAMTINEAGKAVGYGFGKTNAYEWYLTYDSSIGYYRIKNVQSNTYLTSSLPSDVSSSPTLENESIALAERQLWKITRLQTGHYKLQAKVLESVNMVTAMKTTMSAEDAGQGYVLNNIPYTEDDGYNDIWIIYQKGNDVLTLSLQDSNHKHGQGIFETIPLLGKANYNKFNINLDYMDNGMSVGGTPVTTATIKNALPLAKVFITRSHGNYDDNGTYLESVVLNNHFLTPSDIYNFEEYTVVTNMGNCDLAMFVACYTGANLENGLLIAALEAGADCAIGFKDTISCTPANDWLMNFWKFQGIYPNYHIQNLTEIAIDACGDYYDKGKLIETNLDSYVILQRQENYEIYVYENEDYLG